MSAKLTVCMLVKILHHVLKEWTQIETHIIEET